MFDKRLSLIVTIFISIFLLSRPIQAQTWTELFPTGDIPLSRGGHTTVYDITNNRMTIFGGYSNGTLLNDVWVLSNTNGLSGTPSWTQLTITGNAPSARIHHSAVYDTNNNLMTIFGGNSNLNGPSELNDAWILSYANGLGGTPAWTQISPNPDPTQTTNGYGGFPEPRESNTAIYDSINNRMTIFAGQGSTEPHLSDVWVLNNANGLGGIPVWTQLTVAGNLISGRYGHTAVYDTTNNLMIIFGGITTGNSLNDVWLLSNANGLGVTPTWTQLAPLGSNPRERYFHTAVYDNIYNRMVIYGGIGGTTLNDTWVLSNANGQGETPNWTQIFPITSISTPRVTHSAIFDPSNNRMTIYGGINNGITLNDIWVLDDANGLPLPSYPSIPSLKLFINQSFNPAFNLFDYDTTGVATNYSIVSNFLALSTLTGSTVYQASYDSATVGTNIYEADNSFGSSTATNKVKYSTYKIYELPQVGLSVGNWWDVKVGNYTYNSDGLAVPPSFGNPDALIVSDTSSISATWLNNTVIRITSLQSFTGAVNVDIIASPNATSPFGSDIDKERIEVYSNLLQNGTFSTASDTSAWGLQTAPGYPYSYHLATQTWIATQVDSAGDTAYGIWQFIFADSSSGIRVTPFENNYIPFAAGKWYITRMRLCDAFSNNSDEALLYSFSTTLGTGYTGDVAADAFINGIPTTWTWMEAPFYVHAPQTLYGYPQFQLKARGAGSVFIDEIQVIQATPKILEGTRGNIRAFVPGGLFTQSTSTTLWGQQGFWNAAAAGLLTPQPAFTLTTDTAIGSSLSANFAGAGVGAYQIGFKWTYGGTGFVITPSVIVGRQYGANMKMNIVNGLSGASELSQALIATFGCPVNGTETPLDKIEAAAEVGVLVNGTLTTVGIASDPYAQLQFAVRADTSGILDIANVDIISDTNDPNFGDGTLFP